MIAASFGTMANKEGNEHENIILIFVFTGTFSKVLFHLIRTRASADAPHHGQRWWSKPIMSEMDL